MIEKHATYFEPWVAEGSRADTEDVVVNALQGNVHKLCDIDHNVIYRALAIKALRDMPGLCSPEMTEGLRDLIRAFDTVRHVHRWEGKNVQELILDPDGDFTDGVEDVVELTFSEFLKFRTIYDLDVHKA